MKSIRPTPAATGCPASYDERFKSGERPQSFDKDFIRAWVTARCDPYTDRIPKSRQS